MRVDRLHSAANLGQRRRDAGDEFCSRLRKRDASRSAVKEAHAESRLQTGHRVAEPVLAQGHRLIAAARKPEQLADLVERYGDRVRAVALDVTDESAARAAVQAAVDAFGSLDVLVNNAGYGDLAPIEDTTLEDFRAQIETNLFGVINVTKAALPVMRRQGSGHIIQFASVGGRVGPVGRGAYAAAKFGVQRFSEVLAKDAGPR